MAFDQSRHDDLAKKDTADLSEEEALELALLRSEVSLAAYDPSLLRDEAERVVELPDHSSTTLGDLAKNESQPVNVRLDAQSAIDNPPPSSPVFQEQMKAQVEASAPGPDSTSNPPKDTTTPAATPSTPSTASTDTSKSSGSGSGSSSTSSS